ncbi:MAG: ABC transporter permease [Actinomycetota bacterium]|nr:ABC transporter permease [Actinomycetota bacterium]
MTQVLTVAGANLRRTFRDRTAVFFVVVLPIVIIIVIGSAFGGDDAGLDVGLVNSDGDSVLAQDLLVQLEGLDALHLRRYDEREDLRRAVRRNQLVGGVAIPAGYDAALRRGGQASVELVADPTDDTTAAIRAAVGGVANRQAAAVAAARFAAGEGSGTIETNLETVRRLQASASSIGVDVRTIGTMAEGAVSRFAYTAPANLVLFVFVNSLAAAAALVETRRLGVSRRMLAMPVSSRTILAGETLGRLLIALLQAALILAVGALLFDVDWGDPLGAAALTLVFVLLSTGAGMLMGALARTGDQASSIGPPIGIAFGMLGGCMWPLEVVGEGVRTIGHAVPHAWAMDAWVDLIFDGEGFGAILPELAVLSAWTVVLLTLASWRLSHVLTRA